MNKITIQPTHAYLVNRNDYRGNILMDKKSVQALIDNRLGSIIDGMNLGLWPSDKIKLHDALSKTETLSSLSNLYELTQEFANATKDETND